MDLQGRLRAILSGKGWLPLRPIIGSSTADTITAQKFSVGRLEVGAAQRREFDDIARARGVRFRFSAPFEAQFQAYMRRMARVPRVSIALLVLSLFATAPWWASQLLNLPDASKPVTTLVCYGLMVPLFFITSWLQLRHVANEWAEIVLMAAFLIEVIAIEFLIFKTEASGFHVNPSLAVSVPVMMLPISRIKFSRAMIFSGLYFAIVLTREIGWPSLHPRTPTDWMLELILITGAVASVAVARMSARRAWAANQVLDQMSTTDPLTSLPNRTAFEDHFNLFSRIAERYQPMSVLAIIDLDHFKQINDEYGHPYGDGVLTEVAVLLADFARRGADMAARLGGEEFGLFLYDCDVENGRIRLNEFMARLRGLEIEHKHGQLGIVTASIGACVVSPSMRLGHAYHTADQCLYEAKLGGRNSVRIAGVTQAPEENLGPPLKLAG